MDIQASNIVAEGFMKGVFDVLDAMLSVSFSHAVTDVDDLTEDGLGEMLGRHALVMRANVKSGGSVAVLLSVPDASALAALVAGETPIPKTDLGAADITMLKEIADACLGAGVTNLMEKFGRGVEQPENVQVSTLTPQQAAELAAFLGPPLIGATFSFVGSGIDSAGALVFTQGLEELVPEILIRQARAQSEEAAGPAKPEISEAEMADILSGFDAGAEAPVVTPPVPAHAPAPGNIERVLDIRLTATARLGRVEMPIGDILTLGPGSIIDVGRLVDEPVDLLVNDKLIARGDVVVVDEKFGLRITEIVSPRERIESMH